ncbi:PAS domain-containing protein [Mucilaginibacter litoreus]|uniref:PAS domain-containing protein n=1 Tax=Mucilaginibacter litoreus TaxID=1048221 RepID=A0ABW3AQA4_9SPHI
MRIPFTPQLLGDLIEKGYTYMLASSKSDEQNAETTHIILLPVREKPRLTDLPEGFETFYKITREPLQLACGIEGVVVEVEYATQNPSLTESDVFEDSYFRMSEDFFHQVLDSIEDYVVFTTDKNGDVNSWNTGAGKILGYAEAEIIGRNSEIFFTADDRAEGAPQTELNLAAKDGRAINERYHVRKDGSLFWGSGLVFPLFDEANRHRGFTKIMRNLRERKGAETEGSPE